MLNRDKEKEREQGERGKDGFCLSQGNENKNKLKNKTHKIV